VRQLHAEHEQRGGDEPDLIVVLDGADEEEADTLAEALGPGFTVVPDPDGSLAHGVGVRVWPTTVTPGGNPRLERTEEPT
jgi:hypothetical protein